MKRIFLIAAILALVLVNLGCVRRIAIIDSEPQGAEVYFDRKLVGQTPCTHEFLYYGEHHLELVKDGYANLDTTCKLKGPIYEYFPLSLFAELLWPVEITDQHNLNFKLPEGSTRKPIISPIQQPQAPLPASRLERIENNQ